MKKQKRRLKNKTIDKAMKAAGTRETIKKRWRLKTMKHNESVKTRKLL